MEKDNFSAEQDNTSQPSEVVEYPDFDPDKAKKLRETEATMLAIGERKMSFLNNIDAKIASGELPDLYKDVGRKREIWSAGIEVIPAEQIETTEEHLGRAFANHVSDRYRMNDGRLAYRHEVQFPEDIFEYDAGEQTIRHEFSHMLEGLNSDLVAGMNRLFEDENSYLGTCINEGMTDYMAELVSGQKNVYEKDEKNGKIPGYPRYYKFIKFLSSAGATKVDMKYFVDAYCLSGDEGDQAVATLKNKLAEAFPTENGTNPLDNLAAHNQDQIEYWISTYTQNMQIAITILCYNKIMNFDEKFLQEMGLSAMPADKKQEFLNYIQEELEVRIGERISKGLTDEQLQEFDSLLGTEEAAKWLQKNRPDYREIVERSIQEMKDAISKNRAKLLA